MDMRLMMVTDDGTDRSFRVPKGVTVIGRTAATDIRIALPGVEDRHCELLREDNRLRVRDLGSELGTHLNGRRIGETDLESGDRLSIGRVAFLVQVRSAAPPTGESITEVKPAGGVAVPNPQPQSDTTAGGASPRPAGDAVTGCSERSSAQVDPAAGSCS